ncbi:MAG: hypothetical protein ACOH1Y_02175 [Propionicimonas sp.]
MALITGSEVGDERERARRDSLREADPNTTVTVPLAAMEADAIAEILGVHAVGRTYPAQLVVRRSCGCLPEG